MTLNKASHALKMSLKKDFQHVYGVWSIFNVVIVCTIHTVFCLCTYKTNLRFFSHFFGLWSLLSAFWNFWKGLDKWECTYTKQKKLFHLSYIKRHRTYTHLELGNLSNILKVLTTFDKSMEQIARINERRIAQEPASDRVGSCYLKRWYEYRSPFFIPPRSKNW